LHGNLIAKGVAVMYKWKRWRRLKWLQTMNL
jgi:hypothetical protein